MKKKNISLPFNIKSDLLISLLQSKPGVLISNWLCQGMIYMNRYERLHRLMMEAILLIITIWISAHFLAGLKTIIVSLLITHTFFWIFNGHFYVLMRYLSKRHNNPAKFIGYIEGINERVQGKNFLLAAVAFGSLSKDRFTAASDFDMRFLRKPGFFNSLMAFNFCALERARAFLNAFPLDIYVFDVEELGYKIRADEPPIVMMDPRGVFENKRKVDFQDFCADFHKKFAIM